MKKICIVHGWSGSPNDNWLPWLASELKSRGHEVMVPFMPETDAPAIGPWVQCLKETVASVPANEQKDLYFVGHSVGCQAILRYLETVDSSVGGAVFVAGWFNLENMETDEEVQIAKPWIETPINVQKIKSVLPKSTLVISDNDPYAAFEENKKKFAEIGSKEVVLHNAEHITDLSHPEILAETLALIS